MKSKERQAVRREETALAEAATAQESDMDQNADRKDINRSATRSWEEFLDPDVTRPRLIAASIYIAGFEALRDAIVGRIRDFFWTGFNESTGDRIDPKYQSRVLSRNRSPVYASLDWLREMRAIDDADVLAFEQVQSCRNTLAHKLLSTLGSEGLPGDFEKSFSKMVVLLRKVEVWWITNVEMTIDQDLGGRDVDEDKIVPGRILTIQLLLDIALGDEGASRLYYEEFRKKTAASETRRDGNE
jgi:hypothetical protein